MTLWTTSYYPSQETIAPLLQELISSGVGEEEGGVSFCEIDYHNPDILRDGLALTYGIINIPTLLSFDREMPQVETKITDLKVLVDREKLSEWIRNEAKRRGNGGGEGSSRGFQLPSLFSFWK